MQCPLLLSYALPDCTYLSPSHLLTVLVLVISLSLTFSLILAPSSFSLSHKCHYSINPPRFMVRGQHMYQGWITSVCAFDKWMVHTHIYAGTPRCDSEMIGFIRGKGEGKRYMANGKEGGDRTGRSQIITKRWWKT